jgi:hypothetical protein
LACLGQRGVGDAAPYECKVFRKIRVPGTAGDRERSPLHVHFFGERMGDWAAGDRGGLPYILVYCWCGRTRFAYHFYVKELNISGLVVQEQ